MEKGVMKGGKRESCSILTDLAQLQANKKNAMDGPMDGRIDKASYYDAR